MNGFSGFWRDVNNYMNIFLWRCWQGFQQHGIFFIALFLESLKTYCWSIPLSTHKLVKKSLNVKETCCWSPRQQHKQCDVRVVVYDN